MLGYDGADSNPQLRYQDPLAQLPAHNIFDAIRQRISKASHVGLGQCCIPRSCAQSGPNEVAHFVEERSVLFPAKRQSPGATATLGRTLHAGVHFAGSGTMGPVPQQASAADRQHLHSHGEASQTIRALHNRQSSTTKQAGDQSIWIDSVLPGDGIGREFAAEGPPFEAARAVFEEAPRDGHRAQHDLNAERLTLPKSVLHERHHPGQGEQSGQRQNFPRRLEAVRHPSQAAQHASTLRVDRSGEENLREECHSGERVARLQGRAEAA
eukprot:scaffold2165_cov294-Pinguiococcus_pyrenoidosus.AAC.4